MKSCIKINDKETKWFQTKSGIKQGQNDSPTLFAIYVNSLSECIKTTGKGVKIGEVSISLLLYADDIILLAENELDLQVLLNELHNWCSKWRMAINADKTQVIHFRNRKVPKTTMSFHVGNEELKIVNSYRYWGALADGACRALGKLLSTYYRNKGLGIRTYTKLYESCIIPIMDYCSGVWGFTGNEKLDKIHMRAMRCYLGVNRYSAKVGIEGELGWVNPQIRRWLNMLRLWNRIFGMNNTRLPKIIYEYQLSLDSKGNWCSEIKEIFSRILCNDVYQLLM